MAHYHWAQSLHSSRAFLLQPSFSLDCTYVSPAVRELVMTYGWNATAYQILNPGMNHWFCRSIPAVVGYTKRHNTLLVAGEPVCPHDLLPSVVSAFETFTRQQQCRVCYVCAEKRLRDLFDGSGDHGMVTIGSQPVWDPHEWPVIVKTRRSLRGQWNRSRNKGVVIEAAPPETGSTDSELTRILSEWLKVRSLPPFHFLAEPDTLDGVVTDRVLLVARRGGEAVAYLVASPIVQRNGYLIEQVVRSPRSPNGASELPIDAAMKRFAQEGRTYVTTGLVALASVANSELMKNPFWLRELMLLARAHANRFYNFKGLEHFRNKMAPKRWDTIYAVSNERAFSPGTLYALGEAFSGIAPWRAIAIGIGKAVAQEAGKIRRQAGHNRGKPRAKGTVPRRPEHTRL